MKIQQLSLFMENKPGHLKGICKTLADAGINIVTLSLADTQQFGIVRLIVEEWEKAKAALEAATVPDKPGGIAEVLAVIDNAGVNIEYMYAFAFRHKNEAVLVFRFDDTEKARAALQSAGRCVLDSDTLFAEAK